MNRPKILGGIALASMMLVVLTGCPGMISNVVGSNESVEQAVDEAQQGDTVKVTGTVEEEDGEVDVSTDGVTITGGDEGATIDSKVTVDGNNVTVENVTITKDSVVDGNNATFSNVTIQGKLDTVPGSFQNLTLNNVTVQAWNNANVSGTFSCTRVVQPGGSISTAVGSSSSGDNVCVAPDTYAESPDINAPLTIRGIADPTIESSSKISLSKGTTLQGFKIVNNNGRIDPGSATVADSDINLKSGTTIYTKGDNFKFRNNDVTISGTSNYGIRVGDQEGAAITDNTFTQEAVPSGSSNTPQGVLLSSTTDAVVENNEFNGQSNGQGVLVSNNAGNTVNVTINSNTISGFNQGIFLFEKKSKITAATIVGNTISGTASKNIRACDDGSCNESVDDGFDDINGETDAASQAEALVNDNNLSGQVQVINETRP